ncbi:response regulator transcription factor [Litorivicinus lipolyticus]|uniref:response regulator transcription factor n=1 Tax=Litorivicinus lipolyticus TaxID=418701 RepID=UPI003B5CE8AA
MHRVFLVDDDPEICELLSSYLSGNQLQVTAFGDAESLLATRLEGADCVILDIGLPGMDGLQACRAIRSTHDLPILILTAAGDDVDRILGLEIGADDYMGKPFNPRELLARIRALLRRSVPKIPVGGFAHISHAREVRFNGAAVALTGSEYTAFVTLWDHKPGVVDRDTLGLALHNRKPGPFDRTVDTTVSRLRAKLTDATGHNCVRTVRGQGYALIMPQ